MQTIPAKTIVTRTRSRWWFGTDYNMNLYRGCTHGCIYCDSRSSCYHNPDFDHIAVKENALAIVRDDLRRKVQRGVVATGAMSDPYNPLERKLRLTRHALELLSAYGFGVAVDTKSDLVSRDADVLSEIAAQMPALVKFSITTADPALAARLEPGHPLRSGGLPPWSSWQRRGCSPGCCSCRCCPASPTTGRTSPGCSGRLRRPGTVLLLLARPDHAGGTAGVFLSGAGPGVPRPAGEV